MSLGDGIRRNFATVSQQERDRFLLAIRQMDTTRIYPDGVTHWDKQEDIHKNAHAAGQDVHGGPAFLPWHRELCNRLEALVREVDPALSLHYWDWTTDPRSSPNGAGGTTNLFSNMFMASAAGNAGFPLQDFESTEGGGHTLIWRNVNGGAPGAPAVASDITIVTTGNGSPHNAQFPLFRVALENAHNTSHGYIGGSIAQTHFSFHDPFVFLLHSNVDRLVAMWQTAAGQAWRLDPNQMYGTDGTAPSIVANLEPWSGGSGLRPWAPPDNQQVVKNCKHPTVVAPPLYDFNTTEQSNWRWCHKCQNMYFAGNPTQGVCAAGGQHDHTGSGKYSIVNNTSQAQGQSNWRWCHKCQSMYFAGNATQGVCAAGGPHDHTGSGNYTLAMNVVPGPIQQNWFWCHKCQGLYFGGNGTGGKCPAGGGHDHTGSGNYSLVQNIGPSLGQNLWRWCHKCQGAYFSGNPTQGKCPAGAAHDHTGSGDYCIVDSQAGAPGQHNWRWCHKCQGMYFAGNATPGTCPAGGAHDHTGSGDYSLVQNEPPPPDQYNWRWCHKCQALYFAGNATQGKCPAGGAHDHAGSGNYSIRQV